MLKSGTLDMELGFSPINVEMTSKNGYFEGADPFKA